MLSIDQNVGDVAQGLALVTVQAFALNMAAKGNLRRRASDGTHGFFPDFKEMPTGFVAFGKGIKKGKVVPEMGSSI